MSYIKYNSVKNHSLKPKIFLWFTLVELIVVIVILAILATIAFLSFNSYSASSRDSVRVTDINSIKKSLEIYNVNWWVGYPLPDSYTWVTFSWWVLWYQWFIWNKVARVISSNLSNKPIDPLFGYEYTYSLLWNKREYQIKGNLESWKIWYNWWLEGIFNPFQTSNALSNSWTTCYINGNFNWLLWNTKDSSNTNYILAIPSLVLIDPTNSANTTFTWWSLSKMWSWILQCNWQNNPCVINYNSSNVIYTWIPSTTNQVLTIAQNLQQAYSWSSITNLPSISNILTATWDTLTNIWVWVIKNSVWVNNLQDCPMWDDWNWTACIPDSFTKLLLHFDGNVINYWSNTWILTDQISAYTWWIFWTARAYNSNNNSIVNVPDSDDWSFWTGDYTIESWIYIKWAYPSQYFWIFSQWWNSEAFQFFINSNWQLISSTEDTSAVRNDKTVAIVNWVVWLNWWHHITTTYTSYDNKYNIFLDWKKIDSYTRTNWALRNSTSPVRIWQLQCWAYAICWSYATTVYLDEYRISKWVARWTTDFTPPTRQY